MARFLVFTPAASGHLFPLVPGLLELEARGHEVHMRTGAKAVETARAAGLRAEAVDPRIDELPVLDYEARGADRLRRGLAYLMARGSFERADLAHAIAAVDPDVVLTDTNAYGAAVAAQASGRPWGVTMPSVAPLPGKGIPPYGLGMRPARGPLGWTRDRVLWPLIVRQYAKAMLPRLNELRAEGGLPPLTNPLQHVLASDRLIVLSGEPLEYPRTDLPEKVRMVGPQLWDPPTEAPAWLDEPGDPWVLVTCSTDYQADERLARVAVEALRDEPVRAILTLADAYEHRPRGDGAAPERAGGGPAAARVGRPRPLRRRRRGAHGGRPGGAPSDDGGGLVPGQI